MVRLKLPYLLLFCSSLCFGRETFFMPKNDLHLREGFLSNDVKEADFNRVLDRFQAVYGPILKNNFGATLSINRLWNDNTVNASASQSGNVWTLNMYGGLARAEPTTIDGFALVVCHELGHHVGGFPFYVNQWAASEGQSDYFASIGCAKFMWKDDVAENALSRQKISVSDDFKIPKNLCDKTYATESEQNLCYRNVLAGHSLAVLLGSLNGGPVPKFGTPDSSILTKTSTAHPAAQCRLDTYLAGAVCDIKWKNDLIPGKEVQDRQSLKAVIQASPFACQNYDAARAARPRCWFAPNDYTAPTIAVEKLSLTGSLSHKDKLEAPPLTFQAGETVKVKISGDGDADLYTRWDKVPDSESYDCAPFLFGSNEECTLTVTGQSQTLFTLVEGWASSSNISLSIGVTATAKLCRNFNGGVGALFPCWDDFQCKLISAEAPQDQLNWCISY